MDAKKSVLEFELDDINTLLKTSLKGKLKKSKEFETIRLTVKFLIYLKATAGN